MNPALWIGAVLIFSAGFVCGCGWVARKRIEDFELGYQAAQFDMADDAAIAATFRPEVQRRVAPWQ